MKAKDFRFSNKTLSLLLKGLNLYNEKTLILAYKIEESSGNLYMIISYNDEDCIVHHVEILLGYNKYNF